MLKKFLQRSTFLIAFLCSFSVFAEDIKPLKRSLTLSAGYLERVVNTNEALAAFPLSVVDGYGALFDSATNSINKKIWSRSLIVALELPLSYWLGNSLFVPFHEFGHARFFHATGRKYFYETSGYGKTATGISSFLLLSLGRLVTPPFLFPGSGEAAAVTFGDASVNQELSSSWGPKGIRIVTAAAGLNNQMLLAKYIAQNTYEKSGHITYTMHYLLNKVSGFGYSLIDKKLNPRGFHDPTSPTDISNLLQYYAVKGYGIKHGDIELQSLLSLISGTTFALLRGYYDYVASGDATVKPAEVYGLRIPDVNSYINAHGLSLEVVSGYRFNSSLNLGLAYEFIWKGDTRHQITPSWNFDLAAIAPAVQSLWLKTSAPIGSGMGASFGAEWMPFAHNQSNLFHQLSYFADTMIHNAYTLYGERNITSLTNDKTMAFSAFGGLRLNY